jgi:chromosome partitioning protein
VLTKGAVLGRTIAICNQKGGVGKTTTAVNLAACLAAAENKTLLVDMDSQCNATTGVGIEKDSLEASLYEVITHRKKKGKQVLLQEIITRSKDIEFLDIAPATIDLAGAEVELVNVIAREKRLLEALSEIRSSYEFIIIDSPPSLGLLTVNVLTATDSVLIPIQCEYYALEGLAELLNTIRLVQKNLNTKLVIEGALLTMFDARLNLSKQVVSEAREYFGATVFRTVIPRNVRLAEAPSFGKPILLYDVQSVGAKSYLAVAQELIKRTEALGERAGGGNIP